MGSYLLGLGASAFIYGPLSDSLGRKPILLMGLGLFCLSSWACFWSPSIYWLIAIRLVQGLGAGAAWTVSNGIVKDVTSKKEYTKIMTVIHIVVGFVPAFSPILGGYLGAFLGWRDSFLFLFALSCLAFVIVGVSLTESLAEKRKTSIVSIFNGYLALIRSPILCRYMIVKVLMVMLLFVDASTLSLIFVETYKVPVEYFGYYMALGFIRYLLGGWVCHRYVDIYGNDRLLKWGLCCVLTSNIVRWPNLSRLKIRKNEIQSVV